jgi:exodeoxyribonuclease VII small subunit
MTDTNGDEIAYEAAMAELEEILADLERGDVDVDTLADRLSRASELVRICRSRIAGTRMRVESVIAELDAVEEGADG